MKNLKILLARKTIKNPSINNIDEIKCADTNARLRIMARNRYRLSFVFDASVNSAKTKNTNSDPKRVPVTT